MLRRGVTPRSSLARRLSSGVTCGRAPRLMPCLWVTRRPPARGALPCSLPCALPCALLCALLCALAASSEGVARPVPPWSKAKAPSAGEAESVGGYARGCLYGAAALPEEGAGFRSIRRARNRYYGHPALVEVIARIGARVEALGLRPVEVGDLSQPRGGLMTSGHSSHQIGLDADFWFGAEEPPPHLKPSAFYHPSVLKGPREELNGAVWSDRHLKLLAAAAGQPEVARIFVTWRVKEHLCGLWERGALPLDPAALPAPTPAPPPEGGGEDAAVGGPPAPIAQPPLGAPPLWFRKLRPWFGHDQHFHVRLHCPSGSARCEPQGPLPDGAGCERAELTWFSRAETRAREESAAEDARRAEEEEARLTSAERAARKAARKAAREEREAKAAALYKSCAPLSPSRTSSAKPTPSPRRERALNGDRSSRSSRGARPEGAPKRQAPPQHKGPPK